MEVEPDLVDRVPMFEGIPGSELLRISSLTIVRKEQVSGSTYDCGPDCAFDLLETSSDNNALQRMSASVVSATKSAAKP